MKHVLERLKNEILTDYQAIPFWSWNAELEPEELVRQVRWMKENGMGGFFMHARSGLKTEYLSEDWMECIEACADEAENIGMNAWAYDENGWPSGFAGGKLLEEEENRDQYILHHVGEYDAKATVSYLLDGAQMIRVSDGQAQGEYLNLYIHIATSTADILNPEVVDQFINLTHEQYKEHFGDDFAKKIKGFFTDEPQYQRWNTPYTPMIGKYFQEEYGQDILDSLGLLFVEKEGYRTFRYRYWKGMQALMLKNFAEKLYNWCDDHGVKLTGHYVEETTMGFQIMCCAGCMPFYEYEHIPGIDWLGTTSDSELSAKQVSSAAAQLGKKQIITETFGCCGWNVTPTDLRRIAGFQYVNGVNLMCQHLIPYAEYGNRKHDYPAHYSPVNPWVREEFKRFNDYFTRLGYILAEGEETVNVAMLHPIRSAYFDYKRDLLEQGFGIAGLEGQLQKACRTLSGANIAYHFLDETLLEKYGFVQDGKIGCGKCSYDYLVLPDMYTMDRATEKIVRRYVSEGGKVLLLGEAPTYMEGEPFAYDYLKSNCSLEEIIAAQPYRVENRDTWIYSTRRMIDGAEFLYVVNASDKHAYTQTFHMGADSKSFLKIDLNTYETKRVPLTMTLKPGEAVALFVDKEEAGEDKVLTPYELQFHHAEVSFEENYLPIDFVRYSEDGVHYSEKWPCAALFQKLLQDRKEGTLFLKYEFEVRQIPETIYLRAEDCDAEDVTLNGMPLTETVPCDIEKHVLAYDIAPFVKEGLNEYCVKVNWHENDDVYYALFGENVTESLKNCIVYDSELEPIYVAGTFGVYPVGEYREDEDRRYTGADAFYIGEMPKKVSEPVKEGLPFLAGAVTLKQSVKFDTSDILLQVKGFYHLAYVKVNGQMAGTLMFDKELDISAYAIEGDNVLEIRFVLGNFNLLGPQHFTYHRDNSVSPNSFELAGTWEGRESSCFHEWYDLRKLYED